MQIPLQITFRNIARSEAVEEKIRERAQRLERHYDRVIGCRVAIEEISTRHRKGNHFRVGVDVSVPGASLVANHDPEEHGPHADVYVAIRDAFDAVDRQLKEFAQRQQRR